MAVIRDKKLSWRAPAKKRRRRTGLRKVVEAGLGSGRVVLVEMPLLGAEYSAVRVDYGELWFEEGKIVCLCESNYTQ